MGADLDGGVPAIFYIGDLDELRFYPRALIRLVVLADGTMQAGNEVPSCPVVLSTG